MEKTIYKNNTLNIRQTQYPTSSNSYIEMKNGGLYKIVSKKSNHPNSYIEEIKKKGIFYFAIKVDEADNILDELERPFWFCVMDNGNGLFVSDQIHLNGLKPTTRLYQAFYRENFLGEYKTKENNYLGEIKETLEYLNRQEIKKQPSTEEEPWLKFTMSNRRVKKQFKEYYFKCKGVEFGKTFTYLTPDLLMKYQHYDRTRKVIFEVEKTLHNEGDFKWKLWRLHRTKVRINFIFNEHNKDYHLDLMYEFQKETGADMKNFHFTTYEELKEWKTIKKGLDFKEGHDVRIPQEKIFTPFKEISL